MSARRVRFTATAERHFETERTWWRKNRDNQEIFETALDQALARIATHPNIGTARRRSTLSGLRRTYVVKIDCHLYYTAANGRSLCEPFGAPGGSAVR